MLATKEIAPLRSTKINFTSDDIYNYSGTLAAILRRIQNYRDYQIAEDFIDALKVSGLSQGRIVYYASRLPKLLRWFDINVALKAANPKVTSRTSISQVIVETLWFKVTNVAGVINLW